MQLILSNDAAKTLKFDGQLLELEQKTRLRNSAKKFATFFGLAIGCIFIPVFHFVLVPTFLLISFIVFFKTYQKKNQLVVNGTYACVSCGQNLYFPKEMSREDMRLNCKNCHARYLISC